MRSCLPLTRWGKLAAARISIKQVGSRYFKNNSAGSQLGPIYLLHLRRVVGKQCQDIGLAAGQRQTILHMISVLVKTFIAIALVATVVIASAARGAHSQPASANDTARMLAGMQPSPDSPLLRGRSSHHRARFCSTCSAGRIFSMPTPSFRTPLPT
jgi:hypothetical protein